MRIALHTRAAVLGSRNTRVVPTGQVTLRFGNGPETDGTFEGYANLHNVTDSYGTRFLPGAWRSGGLDTGTYPLLVMHDPARVAGTFTAREDERGLRIEGRFDPTAEGQDARARAQSGSAPELSVGFGRFGTLADDETGINLAELVEVSLITARMASQPGATMTGVRVQEGAGGEVCAACGATPPAALLVADDPALDSLQRAARAYARLRLAGM